MLIFDPKIALRTERSDPALNSYFSARKYTKKNSVKMVFVLYSELCLTAH